MFRDVQGTQKTELTSGCRNGSHARVLSKVSENTVQRRSERVLQDGVYVPDYFARFPVLHVLLHVRAKVPAVLHEALEPAHQGLEIICH
jgi:hypothetical protein